MSNKNKLILFTFLEVVCMLILIVVGGLFDWLNLGWSTEQIVTGTYWKGVVQQFVLYSCSLILGYLMTLEREDLKNPTWQAIQAKYKELLKSKKDSFVLFIENVFNPKTKKRFLIEKAQQRLYRLDRHAKDEWRLAYQEKDKEGFSYPGKDKDKFTKYMEKRIELEKLANREYIEANWKFLSVKYPHINPHSFTEGLNIRYNATTEYQVENNAAKDVLLKLPTKAVTTLLWAVVIGCVIWEPDVAQLGAEAAKWWAIILKYVIRIVMMTVNLAWGTYSGKKLFKENFILPLNNRCRILTEYITWCHDTNQQETYADKVLEAYNKQKTLSENLAAQIKKAELLQKN